MSESYGSYYIVHTKDKPIRYLNFDGYLIEDISDSLKCAAYDTAESYKQKYEEKHPDSKVSLVVTGRKWEMSL